MMAPYVICMNKRVRVSSDSTLNCSKGRVSCNWHLLCIIDYQATAHDVAGVHHDLAVASETDLVCIVVRVQVFLYAFMVVFWGCRDCIGLIYDIVKPINEVSGSSDEVKHYARFARSFNYSVSYDIV